MNKKIMSFVLAMVLSVGLGSNVFASSGAYSDYANEFAAAYSGNTKDGSVEVKVGSPNDLLGGNLTAVFGYYAGSLVSYQGSGGNFQLYDSYGARFSANNVGGIWSVTNANLRASDYAEIAKASSAEEYLKGMGFSENSLAVAKMDKNGNLLDESGQPIKRVNTLSDYADGKTTLTNEQKKQILLDAGYTEAQIKKIDLSKVTIQTSKDDDGKAQISSISFKNENGDDVKITSGDINKKFDEKIAKTPISNSWFAKLKDTLSKGVNFSASVSAGTGITGPTLTVSENGKAQIAYQCDSTYKDGNGNYPGIRPTMLYDYDSSGFLRGYQQAAFEMDSTNESGVAKGKWTFNYTAITYDSKGVRTDKSYQFFDWDKDPSGTIAAGVNVATPDNKKVDENTKVLQTSVTRYSANNTSLFTKDFTTNNTTYFANNRPSYVVNETGTTVELYKYSANGVIQAHFNANGKDADGKKVGTTTIYDQWGRQLFSAVTGSPADVFNNTVKQKNLIAEYETGLKKGFTPAEFEAKKDDKGESYEAKAGTGTSICQVYIYADQILDKSKVSNSAGFISMSAVNNAINRGNLTSVLSNNLNALGYTTSDITTMLRFSNGGNTPLSVTAIAHSSWDKDNIPADAVDADNVEEISTGQTAVTGTVRRSLGTHEYNKVQSTEKTGKKVLSAASGISYSNTIMLGGAQAYTTTHNVVSAKYYDDAAVAVQESDPAVKGTYQGTVEINGKTYVKVSASEVNIMDGNGFQAADGETVLVDIDTLDEDTKAQIMSMKEGDEIMFMGDVRESADGKSFTMAVNTSYSGGVAIGSENISNMREAIQNENLDWVKQNTAINKALIGDQNIGGDWKSGWNILVNGGKKDPKDHIPADDLAVLF